MGALAALTLLPFAIMMVSFVKTPVLSIVRSALGTQQIPLTQVTGSRSMTVYYQRWSASRFTRQRKARSGATSGRDINAETVDMLWDAANRAASRRPSSRELHLKDRAMFTRWRSCPEARDRAAVGWKTSADPGVRDLRAQGVSNRLHHLSSSSSSIPSRIL